MTIHDPEALIRTLQDYDQEQEWFEFKLNYVSPERLGKYISALSNGAILKQKTSAYLVYGIKDETHEIVGTEFSLKGAKKGSEPLEFWLSKRLEPTVRFESVSVQIEGKDLEIIHIIPPYFAPIKFNGIAYTRIGETTPKLSDYPQLEGKLWEILSRYKFETSIINEHVSNEYLLDNFQLRNFFDLLGTSPSDHEAIINKLLSEGLIVSDDQQHFNVYALLGILAANNFTNIPYLERKGVRLIFYKDTSKLHINSDKQGTLGYSLGFENLIEHIMGHIPSVEVFDSGVRETKYDIPQVAIRAVSYTHLTLPTKA